MIYRPVSKLNKSDLLDSADSLNPEALGNALGKVHGEIDEKTAKLNDPGTSAPELTKLSTQLSSLNQESNDLRQALGNLANAAEAGAGIQEKLNGLQKDYESSLGLTERLIRGGPAAQRQFARAGNLAAAATRQGNLAGFSNKQANDILDHLGEIGDKQTGFGRSGNDIKEALLRNSGLVGFDGIGQTVNHRHLVQQQSLLNQRAVVASTAVQANDVLIKAQQGLQDKFFTNLTDSNNKFLSELRKNLQDANDKAANAEKAKVGGEASKAQDKLNVLGGLQNSYGDLSTARKLASNPDLAKLHSSLSEQDDIENLRKTNAVGNVFKSGKFDLSHVSGTLGEQFNHAVDSSGIVGASGLSETEFRTKVLAPALKEFDAQRTSTGKDVSRADTHGIFTRYIDKAQSERLGELRGNANDVRGRIGRDVFGSSNLKGHDEAAINRAARDQDLGRNIGRFDAGDTDFSVDKEARARKAQLAELNRVSPPIQPSLPVSPAPLPESEPPPLSVVSQKEARRESLRNSRRAAASGGFRSVGLGSVGADAPSLNGNLAFAESVDKLSKLLSSNPIPSQISLKIEPWQVNVNLNGAAMIAELEKGLQTYVIGQISEQLTAHQKKQERRNA
jgi:hypothetical protein